MSHGEDNQDDSNIMQAFNDILKGEKTALALENHLSSLEHKIDELLNGFEGARQPQPTTGKTNCPDKSGVSVTSQALNSSSK